jgi:hypothetical protein
MKFLACGYKRCGRETREIWLQLFFLRNLIGMAVLCHMPSNIFAMVFSEYEAGGPVHIVTS